MAGELSVVDVVIEAMPFADALVGWCTKHPEFREALKFSNLDGFLPLGAILTSYPRSVPHDEVIGFLVYDMAKGVFKQDYIVNIDSSYEVFRLYTKLPNKKYSKYVQHIKQFFAAYGQGGDYADTHHYTLAQICALNKPGLSERARDTIALAQRLAITGRRSPSQQELRQTLKVIRQALGRSEGSVSS